MNASNPNPNSGQKDTAPLQTTDTRQNSIPNHGPGAQTEPTQEAWEVPSDPGLAELSERMASGLLARRRKSPWVTDDVRAEKLLRYRAALDATVDAPLRDFLR